MITNDYSAFIESIKDNPFSKKLKLIFADWLYENGQEELEKRIRFLVKAQEAIDGIDLKNIETKKYNDMIAAERELAKHKYADWLLRLATVVFCRRNYIWSKLTDNRSIKAVKLAYLFTFGLISELELDNAYADAANAADCVDDDMTYIACAARTTATADTVYVAYIATAIAIATDAVDAEHGYQVKVMETLSKLSC